MRQIRSECAFLFVNTLLVQAITVSIGHANIDPATHHFDIEATPTLGDGRANNWEYLSESVGQQEILTIPRNFSLSEGLLEDKRCLPNMSDYVDWEEIWQACFDESIREMTVTPNFACSDQGCATNARCVMGAPAVRHMCYVDACGDAGCRGCPSWVADVLKHIAFKTWCSYVCVQTGTSPLKVVAVGAGAVSSFKGAFIGPFCISY